MLNAEPNVPADAASVTHLNYNSCLQISMAKLLQEAGFQTATQPALETLMELVLEFFIQVGRLSKTFANMSGRSAPTYVDILLALRDLGASEASLSSFIISKRGENRVTSAPELAQPYMPPPLLKVTQNEVPRALQQPGLVLPGLPDTHTYTRTPTFTAPVTNVFQLREKKMQQKRDIEWALMKFRANAGESQSFFPDKDKTLFPLISCKRPENAGPAYLQALLFQDQRFDEENIEFVVTKKPSRKRKRKEKEEK